MTKLLLSVHVLVAILTVGSIAVAASMFPRYALRALGGEAGETGEGGGEQDGRSAAIAAVLHRICRAYAVAGVAVPVFGIATGAQLGVLTDAWLIVSLVLTVIAAAVLGLIILPGQERLLTADRDAPGRAAARPTAMRLTMITGAFNLLWAIVVVLMIIRPGSTTGA